METRKIISIILVLAMLVTIGTILAFAGNEKTKLSELSDEQLLSALFENGLEIPEEFNGIENAVPYVRRVVKLIDENQDLSYAAGWAPGYELHMGVISAAEKYYKTTSPMVQNRII